MGFAKSYRDFIFHPRESRQLQKLSSSDEKATADVSHLSAVNVSASGKKKELRERDAWDKLGYSFPEYKKWYILLVLFFIQISINLNASLYANGVGAISEEYGISEQAARVPQLCFLVAYAFGCLIWAPWSEEFGRWPTQQLSLFLVNIWQLPCIWPPSFATLVVARTLGGLSIAGGSVTLGVLSDMWLPDDQEFPVSTLVLSSVGGSVVGAVIGGFLEEYAPLRYIFITQVAFGTLMQLIHFFVVPETRSTIILDREAKKRRLGGENVYGPNELDKEKLSAKDLANIYLRPFKMLFTEQIVAWLSLLSGFSDNLIFIFLQAFAIVYKQYGFSASEIGMSFTPLLAGYFIAYLSFQPSIQYFRKQRQLHGSKSVPPEKRLWWLLFLIWLEPIGLFGFAFTSYGPSKGIPYIAPMLFSALVGIANYSVYQSSIDYTVAAYGVYAASATGGNDFMRDFLSGIAALYSVPLYENLGSPNSIQYASLFLALVSIFVTSPVLYFYARGERIRKASPFASKIQEQRDAEADADKKGGGSARVQEAEDEEIGPQDPEYYKRKHRQDNKGNKRRNQHIEISEKRVGRISRSSA